MNRLGIPVALVAMAAVVYFVLSWEPTPRSFEAKAPASVITAPAVEAPAPPPTAPPAPPASAAPRSEAEAPAPVAGAPRGPFVVRLGEYITALRDSPKRVRIALEIQTDNPVTQREIRAKSRKLRRMIYFLSAHRTEAGMTGAAGRARFHEDLRERLDNLIKSGDVDALRLTTFELIDPPEAPPSAPASR